MNVLGSVFLGDASRQRVLSPSPTSPPTSPSPYTNTSASQLQTRSSTKTETSTTVGPQPIDPRLSLELRIRWLEVLLLGVKRDSLKVGGGGKGKHDGGGKDTLVLKAEQTQKRLDTIVESNDGLRQFMDRYDQHAQILTPSFALSGISSPPSDSSMTSEELDALLAEMEPEIREADRDLREIDILEKRGVLGAGKLSEYEALAPRIETLQKAREEDQATVTDIERRVGDVLRQYTTRIDALSELFVEWNDVLSAAEDKITRLEREKAEKVKLGLQ